MAEENQSGDTFFGEPALDLNDWFACDEKGQGYVNIMNTAQLIQHPQIHFMFPT
nr:helicase HerA-like domain-containing protein [Paratractidigestivibacter sp.]